MLRCVLVLLLAGLWGVAAPSAAAAEETATPTPSVSASEPGGPGAVPSVPAAEPIPTPTGSSTSVPSATPSATSSAAAPTAAVTASPAAPAEAPDAAPGFSLTITSDQEPGALVWADDAVAYEVVGTNTGDARLASVTITDDLSGVLAAASLEAEPSATITHPDGGTSPTATDLSGRLLTWTGHLEVGESVRIAYVVDVAAVTDDVALHNVATATWAAEGGPQQDAGTAEVSNPVNPTAVAGADDDPADPPTLAATGTDDTSGLLCVAAVFLLTGLLLVTARRREKERTKQPE